MQCFVVDAFTSEPFRGNPAGVCFLDSEVADEWMLAVAAEMKHAETAFLLARADGSFGLRWFTPATEVPLCGHATLASAHALWDSGRLAPDETARFHTLSGELRARPRDDGRIELDFPLTNITDEPDPGRVQEAVGAGDVPVRRTPFFTLVELPDAVSVRGFTPDFHALSMLATDAVIITARSDDPRFDVSCRVFAPRLGIPEDEVTGSAMCVLAPYWRARLGDELRVEQCSARHGDLHVRLDGDRVLIGGHAITVLRGELVTQRVAAMRVLVTGAAGFIGSHVSTALLARGDEVIGFDNLNDYYDPALKQYRLDLLADDPGFAIVKGDVRDMGAVDAAFGRKPDRIVHLAAQAGVRHSLTHPHDYVDNNVTGTLNVLEACRAHGTAHLVYASSSSVYGANTNLPFAVHDNVDHPVSMYAATKKSTELIAHAYSHLFGIPTTGLRFFTVYGPRGRPDMALFLFTKAILEGRPIDVYNNGQMQRDFTYIDDIVEGVVRVLDRPAQPDPSWTSDAPDPASSSAPYRIYNIGNNRPVELLRFIAAIEDAVGRKAVLNMMPMQPGDVRATTADVDALARDVGFAPDTPIEVGVARFVEWYLEYYGRGD